MTLSSFLCLSVMLACARGELMMTPSEPTTVRDLTSGQTSPILVYCQALNKTVQEAQLKWFDKNDNQITATSGSIFIQDEIDELILRIATPTEEDEGTYTCRGRINGVDKAIKKQVEFYRGTTVLSPAKQYLINDTDDKIRCETQQGTLEATISWYKLNEKGGWVRIRSNDKFKVHRPLKKSDEPDYLLVRNVTLEDEATYVCNIDNRVVGRSLPYHINVSVTVPPSFVGQLSVMPSSPVEREDLHLKCEATGIPTPTYTFKKDDEVLVNGSKKGHHVIKNVSRHDEGNYVCEASNHGGSDVRSFFVDIRVPPMIEEQEGIVQEENTLVELACVTSGDPAPSVSWRLKGAIMDITNDSVQRVHVREEMQQDQNPVTKVHERTLYLVIQQVKPADSGTYECQASNTAGMLQKEFQINVTYRPIFDDNADSNFYGWVGSNTNLTCIANGNPLPEILWFKDSLELKKDATYDISTGESGQPTRAISYLTPYVDETNQGSIFGEYKCEAKNDLGKNEVILHYNLAVPPEEPELSVLAAKATVLTLEVAPPQNDGGQPVTTFIIKYKKANSSDDMIVKNATLPADQDKAEVQLEKLTPNTAYVINISAVNNVGVGQEKTFNVTTADFSKPDPVTVTSNRVGDDATTYILTWNVPANGGAEIKNYKIEYAQAEDVNTDSVTWTAEKMSSTSTTLSVEGQASTQVKIRKLVKDTYYKLTIKAVNRIDSSDMTTFLFKTGLGGHPLSGADNVRASMTGLLLVAMVMAYFRRLLC